MNRSLVALFAVVLTLTLHPNAVFAQELPSCIYDPAIESFRAFDAKTDATLFGETLAERERPESVSLQHKRFKYTERVRSTLDEANNVLREREKSDGTRWFSTTDVHGDLALALASPVGCIFEVYRYAPVIHAGWVEEQPFVFHFPALAVDRNSLYRSGDKAGATGFMMRGHPHPEQDPTLYYRLSIETDCAAARTRIFDMRSFAAENTLHQRFAVDDAWQANDDLTHPASRMLAHVACNMPDEWPAATKLESLDEFSQKVHQAAHAQ